MKICKQCGFLCIPTGPYWKTIKKSVHRFLTPKMQLTRPSKCLLAHHQPHMRSFPEFGILGQFVVACSLHQHPETSLVFDQKKKTQATVITQKRWWHQCNNGEKKPPVRKSFCCHPVGLVSGFPQCPSPTPALQLLRTSGSLTAHRRSNAHGVGASFWPDV